MKINLTKGKMKGNEVSEKGIHQTCDGNHKYIIVSWHHPRQRRYFDSCPVGYFNKKIFINPMTLYWRSKATIV